MHETVEKAENDFALICLVVVLFLYNYPRVLDALSLEIVTQARQQLEKNMNINF